MNLADIVGGAEGDILIVETTFINYQLHFPPLPPSEYLCVWSR